MFQQTFYFSLIKKYVILFGTIFKDTYIKRYDINGIEIGDIKVPVQYAPKDKMFVRLLSDPEIDRQYSVLLPRMSFEITSPGFTYDPSRKLNSMNKYVVKDPTDLNKVKFQYQPVPYDISFALYIYAASVEDGLKIVEQIVPMFTPDWTATVHLIPEMNEHRDIPIIMVGGPVMTDIYDGDFKKRRMITWNINFNMKAWFFGPVKLQPIIKYVITDLYVPNSHTEGQPLSPNTSTLAEFITTTPTLLANGSPTSNAAASIPIVNIAIDDDFGFSDVKSGDLVDERQGYHGSVGFAGSYWITKAGNANSGVGYTGSNWVEL